MYYKDHMIKCDDENSCDIFKTYNNYNFEIDEKLSDEDNFVSIQKWAKYFNINVSKDKFLYRISLDFVSSRYYPLKLSKSVYDLKSIVKFIKDESIPKALSKS